MSEELIVDDQLEIKAARPSCSQSKQCQTIKKQQHGASKLIHRSRREQLLAFWRLKMQPCTSPVFSSEGSLTLRVPSLQ
jgi:hypothetical protein